MRPLLQLGLLYRGRPESPDFHRGSHRIKIEFGIELGYGCCSEAAELSRRSLGHSFRGDSDAIPKSADDGLEASTHAIIFLLVTFALVACSVTLDFLSYCCLCFRIYMHVIQPRVLSPLVATS
jgi:hypothetical protein